MNCCFKTLPALLGILDQGFSKPKFKSLILYKLILASSLTAGFLGLDWLMPRVIYGQSLEPLPLIFHTGNLLNQNPTDKTNKTGKTKLNPNNLKSNNLNSSNSNISNSSLSNPNISNASKKQPLSIDPATKRRANELRQQGLNYRQQQRFSEAINALEQAAQLDPEAVDGWIILGWTQHLDRKSPEAASSLWQAIYRRPTTTEAFNAIGIVYLVRGELPQAALLHSWAALLKTDNEIAHYNLNLTYQRQQQFDLALAHGELAASLEPTNPHPFVALAITHWLKGDRPQAKQAYQSALRLDGRYQSSEFLDHLTEAGFDNTQVQQAKQVLAMVK
jgi:tetratricopeptide (TPR) repeat protein